MVLTPSMTKFSLHRYKLIGKIKLLFPIGFIRSNGHMILTIFCLFISFSLQTNDILFYSSFIYKQKKYLQLND